jgi:hypothetical protein
MSRFNMLPREGHLKAVKRILCYLKIFPKGRVIIDTSYPDHSLYPVEDHSNRMEFYPDTSEEIAKDLPPEKGLRVRAKMTFYVDADHASQESSSFLITLLLYGYPSFKRQWRDQLTAQNRWWQGFLRNSFLKLGTCFGH